MPNLLKLFHALRKLKMCVNWVQLLAKCMILSTHHTHRGIYSITLTNVHFKEED